VSAHERCPGLCAWCQVEDVIETIIREARTGEIGDGKILVRLLLCPCTQWGVAGLVGGWVALGRASLWPHPGGVWACSDEKEGA